MLTNGAKRSRRCGGTDTRATQTPPCSDRPAAAALAARTRALARLAATRDASRPPASHLKGDADGGTLQLFYLKEKKKKIPNHTKNKTNNDRNSGSLCLLSVLCGGLPELAWPRRGSQRRARLPDSPPGPVDQRHHRALWSPAGPAVAEGTGVALGCLCPRDYPRTPPGSRARAAGVASDLRGGRVLGFCPCAPFLAFLVHGPPPRAPTGPLLSSSSSSGCRISVAWLSVCLSASAAHVVCQASSQG